MHTYMYGTYQFFSESVVWVRVSLGMEYTCFLRPFTNVVTLGYPLYSGSKVRMVSERNKMNKTGAMKSRKQWHALLFHK